jgi:hypothetical protein
VVLYCSFVVCIALPTYIGLHPVSTIVTFDYGYVTSISYLHDIQPVIFVGFFLLLLFLIVINVIRSFAFLNHIVATHQGREMSSTSTSWENSPYGWRKYFIFLALNLINLVAVMTVNIAYVNTLINSTTNNRIELLFIQVAVGLFKVVWNSLYVPWSCDWSATFSSHRGNMRSRYVMSIVNYVVTPVVSTIAFSESCFYFVFKSAEETQSYIVLRVIVLVLCKNSSDLCPPPRPLPYMLSSRSIFAPFQCVLN